MLIISLTGCGNADNSNKNNSENATTSEISISTVPIETVAVPEGGWTVEELAKTIYFNGMPIETPFTLENLGEDYSIKKEDTQILDGGACGTILYYKESAFITVNYNDVQSFDELPSKEAQAINTYWENKNTINNIDFSFNGIRLGASMSEVENVFGEADTSTENSLIYVDKSTDKNCIGFLFNDNEELYTISIIFNEYVR